MSDRTAECAEPQRRSIGAKRNPATEEAILTAAQDILREKGVKGLTMEAVARRARAGKATLYKWWPSRGALLVSVYERAKGDHQHQDEGNLIDTIASFYRYVFAFWRTPEGEVFRLIIAEAQSDEDVAEALERYRKERLVTLAEVVDWSIARGELRAGMQAEVLAETIMAAAWMRLITGRLETDPRQLASEVLCGCLVGKG